MKDSQMQDALGHVLWAERRGVKLSAGGSRIAYRLIDAATTIVRWPDMDEAVKDAVKDGVRTLYFEVEAAMQDGRDVVTHDRRGGAQPRERRSRRPYTVTDAIDTLQRAGYFDSRWASRFREAYVDLNAVSAMHPEFDDAARALKRWLFAKAEERIYQGK